MSKYYHDYVWKKGIPYGINPVSEDSGQVFKIPMDPYRKRIAVEEWRSGKFMRVIYDSAFLDFRHLHPLEQTSWQKVVIQENREEIIAEIRNQDDRTILIEKYLFEQGLCRRCHTLSPHGIPISMQEMFYNSLGDDFNGVILRDNFKKQVMYKKYGVDEQTLQFSQLLEEEWDMQKSQIPESIHARYH